MRLMTIALCSASMSVVALMLMLIDAFALRRRQVSARAMRLSWLVVMAGFILPLRPEPSWLSGLLPHAEPALDALRGQLASALPLLATVPQATGAPLRHAANTYAQTAEVIPAVTHWQPDWSVIAALVYIAGAVLVMGVELWRHWRFRRTVLRWSYPADEAVSALSQTQIVISRAVQSPTLIGVLHPVIVLPDSRIPSDELRAMVAHEERHRASHDVLIQYAVLLARALNWFNPLMPLFAAELTLKCEQLCDELTLNSCSLDRRAYIATILAAAATRRAPLTTGFSGGKYIMKRRLTALYSRTMPRMGALLLVMALALTIFVPSLVALAAADSSAQTDAQPASTSDDAQPQPTGNEGLPQPTQAVMIGGDTAADIYNDLLTITLANPAADELTAAILIMAVGDGVNEVLNALDAYDLLEKAYRDEGLSFDETVEKYLADNPIIGNEAMFDLMAGAPRTGIATQAKLMLASGELFSEIYARLALGNYDGPSILSACLAYNIAAYDGRVADVCIINAAERARAMNALIEWGAAISPEGDNAFVSLFGTMDAERAEIEAQLEAEQRDDIQLLPIEGEDEAT